MDALELAGWEGIWGGVLCVFVIMPLFYTLPGAQFPLGSIWTSGWGLFFDVGHSGANCKGRMVRNPPCLRIHKGNNHLVDELQCATNYKAACSGKYFVCSATSFGAERGME